MKTLTASKEPSGIFNIEYSAYIFETSERPISTNRKHKITAEVRDCKRKHYSSAWAKLRGNEGPLDGFCTVEISTSFFQDVDAPIKFVLDTMKGTLIVDDKQVIKITVARIKTEYELIKIKLIDIGCVRDLMNIRLGWENANS